LNMRSINLIPVQRRVYRRVRRRLRIWTFALAGAVGLMVLACGLLRARVPVAAPTDAELTKTAARLNELNACLAAASTVAADREWNQNALAMLNDQPDWSLLLQLLASQIDEQTVLREVRLTPASGAPTAPGITPAARQSGRTAAPRQIELPSRFKLELRGLCRSPAGVSQFVANVEKLGVVSDVKLVRTGREPFLAGIASNFELEGTLGEMRGEK
jgi:Tfp pilus assembly protein PilN